MTVVGIYCSPFETTFMSIKCLIYSICDVFNECEILIQEGLVCCIPFIVLYMCQVNQTSYLAYYYIYASS